MTFYFKKLKSKLKIMKKIQNKFIIVIIIFIVAVVWIETYKSIFLLNIDRNSYVVLIEWEATLNNIDLNKNIKLEINQKELLNKKDKIKTIWEKSLAIIKWWDWSITRMGGNSEIIVEKADVEKNLLNIQISFKLEKWKTWSDVISFIWEDSYFHETFADTTAAVRWTVFEVNLIKEYLYVESHEVKLTKGDWKTEIIWEKKPFDLNKFSFIDLSKFIINIQDKAWKKLNNDLDKEFYNSIIKNIWDINNITINKIENINELTGEKKIEIYNELLSEYQKFNFIKADDIENYWKKIELKKELITLAWEKDKQNLIITTLYDFKDLINNKQFWEVENTFLILVENKDYLQKLDINISDYFNYDVFKNIKIPEWLKKEFENNLNDITNLLNLEKIDLSNNEIFTWLEKSGKQQIDTIKNLNLIEKIKEFFLNIFK